MKDEVKDEDEDDDDDDEVKDEVKEGPYAEARKVALEKLEKLRKHGK